MAAHLQNKHYSASIKKRVFAVLLLMIYSLQLCAFRAYPSDTSSVSELVVGNFDTVSTENEYSAEAYLFSGVIRGTLLFENQSTKRIYSPLSGTLMTIVMTLAAHDINDTITISSRAAILASKDTYDNRLLSGDSHTIGYLIALVLYHDSKGAEYALAENLNPNAENLTNEMNAKAALMSLDNTHYSVDERIYETGRQSTEELSDDDEYTTASDLDILFRYALKQESFRKIFADDEFFHASDDDEIETEFAARDIPSDWAANPEFQGLMQTQADEKSDTYDILIMSERDGFSVAYVLLRANTDSESLLMHECFSDVYGTFTLQRIATAGEVFGEVTLPNYSYPTEVSYMTNLDCVTRIGEVISIENAVFTAYESMPLPLHPGDVIGYVRFTLADGSVLTSEVTVVNDIWAKSATMSYISYSLSNNRDILFGIVFCIAAILCILVWKLFLRGGFRRNKEVCKNTSDAEKSQSDSSSGNEE
ncbi:MAG TPA: hypothetical protein PK567_07630 [Bacillota bacterium]|nr:hypothetical protein [Bacillota bacterium]